MGCRFETVGSALTRESGRPVEVQGLLAFVGRGTGQAFGDLQRPTNMGSFDVNFTALGFDARSGSGAAVAAARAWGSDSITMLLGNNDVQPAVRMSGTWAHDSIVGSWWVVSSRAVASQGTFVLTKRRER